EQIVVTPSGMQGLTGPSPGQPRSGKPYLVTHGGMEMDARDLLQGLTGPSPRQQSRGGAPYLVARNGMQMDARDLTQGAGGGRPIQIVQNFNAPVDRS